MHHSEVQKDYESKNIDINPVLVEYQIQVFDCVVDYILWFLWDLPAMLINDKIQCNCDCQY
jgi:hypothetical protein